MIVTRQPTSNTSPDPGQGGGAVTGPVNTGHASTVCSDAPGGGNTTKSCIWAGFSNVVGQKSSIKLKLDYTETGSIPDGTNEFRIEYSVNGGGAWSTIIDHSDISSSSGTVSVEVALSNGQDISQVQVRDFLLAGANTLVASVTTSISNIRIDVTTAPESAVMIV